ncbi:putative bifunctional diguanylate cyclase/phosphodiesterase [Paractinoplanes rishiriensis]|uniref:GGDEF-domain containing protein n=1 Tax=Paractinoplanes rishiriensis TaxID=1050105 RepID=A0A919JSX2_9ACTN|nr:EAL domain-containing protein [Actinoplanes rishiriensis]GIE92787.1 GGDEF-domain containing protein [Actinoplanes rishiriensis]
MTARLFVTLTLVLGAVVVGELVGPRGWRLSADAAQAVAGAAAAWVCLAAAGRRTGIERHWRRMVGAGLVAWTALRVAWVVRDIADPGRAVTSAWDIGFLVLPLCILFGLLTAPYVRPRPVPTSPRRDQIALLIDSVLIAGSLLALVWSALPERLMDWAGQPPLVIGMAVAHPIADLVLLTMVVLLLATRPASRAARRPLQLAGLAVIAFGVTDTLRLANLADLPLSPLQTAGHLLGPALLAVAASCNAGGTGPVRPNTAERDWLHLLLPYVPVTATGIVIAISTGAGNPLSPFEAYLGWLGLGLVVARQMFTIVDNTVLLDRVSEGQRRLHHQAYHDPLTGLANRALYRERLVLALDAHRHRGRPLAVLFADLDDFKLINDSFGHAMGDRVLRAIAERLQGCVPADDLVARLGGDEFAVLLDHRPADAEPVGHRILAALREPFIIDGHRIGVGASIGLVVPEPGEALSADALLRRADAAMYASKRRGKGALARYAGAADAAADADLPHLLAQALATGGRPGFEVHYQPIVRLADGATVAVEALARWTSAAGPVHPDVFVTVAERTGQVAAIDDFVLDQACGDATRLAVVYGRPIDVHVNVSAARLGQDGLEEAVNAALTGHHLPPSRLVIEITETHRIPDLAVAAAAAGRLRALGVRVALDDFGSGFNALAQLHALPVDIVKLDSTLTDVEEAPGRAGAVCRSILTICGELDIVVVAEGIETPARAAGLSGLGCPLGQGYLFGQPGPLHRLESPVIPSQPSPSRIAGARAE